MPSSTLPTAALAGFLVIATCGCNGGNDSSPNNARSSSERGSLRQGRSAEDSDSNLPHSESLAKSGTRVRFDEISAEAGVDFTYHNGEESGYYAILESLGGGAGVFDFDGDGLQDVYLPGGGAFGGGPSVRGLPGGLFRQIEPLHFCDVTRLADAGQAPFYSHGAYAADYDNDGFSDLLVTGYGGVLLLHNAGDGTFHDVTAESGLAADSLWSSSAAWADLNGDGILDLYLVHYVDWSPDNNPVCKAPPPYGRDVCPPRQFDPLPDALFFGRDDGIFEDVSKTVGLREGGKGLGIVAADVDVDGDVDLYVANDTVPNFLYRNDGDGHLEDVSLISGASFNDRGSPDGSMGVDVADFNMDGLPDLWCVNYENESLALYRNEGNCLFQHVSQSTGIKAVMGLRVSWGTVFFDVDYDGDEDVFVSNGHVVRHPVNASVRQEPLLLVNDSGRRFVDVSSKVGGYFNRPHAGRGVAAGDLDNDGNLDLVVSHVNEPVAVLHNQTDHGTHWIGFRLIGVRSPRGGIGARIEIRDGDRILTKQIKGGGSYASTHDPRMLFGLGDRRRVERAVIAWPSGVEQVLRDLAADRYHTVVETEEASP